MSTELEFPFADLPAPGATLCVEAGVHWVRMPLPFALDHINLWLLDDGEGVAIVDTGIGHADTRALWGQVFATLARPVTQIIVTHAHPDHIGNARWLADRFGVPVHVTLGEYLWAHAVRDARAGFTSEAMVALFRRHGLDDARAQALLARGNNYARGVPELPESYLRIRDGSAITIGGNTWRVIAGYGHSAEHAALWCEALHVLISGDMLLPRISTNVSTSTVTPQDDPVAQYTESLARFAALPADALVLPSHGRPFRGAQARIAQLVAHHEERCGALLAALYQPMSAGELLATLFPRELDTHQVMFAMGEAIGHLNHLAARGLVSPVEAAGGMLKFARTGT
ncbi:MBL fold metallo-hydrolase [Niveibacterium sp. 24ML]|uniref:MBL fold metallo-hydrolase n=1 Tax=Niveibacterium sp. 24ML TaxID=2985512 RepID=UPI00226E6466|nr:MBL fold metallo-hydrolase [Niveibacterium sp. 24ML]MCX9155762.1 MBL fold metallo-hydrolase [Niveibacterium sp. 24ML]